MISPPAITLLRLCASESACFNSGTFRFLLIGAPALPLPFGFFPPKLTTVPLPTFWD